MMKVPILLLLIATLPLPAKALPPRNPRPALAASAPGSVWSIDVVGLKGEALGSVTLELSNESARTCMAGEWKKARLVQSSYQSPAKQFETNDYFPTFETNGEKLTIQLNPPGLCDAYLFLSGKFTEIEGKGDYFQENLGGVSPLGTFSAKRQPQ